MSGQADRVASPTPLDVGANTVEMDIKGVNQRGGVMRARAIVTLHREIGQVVWVLACSPNDVPAAEAR